MTLMKNSQNGFSLGLCQLNLEIKVHVVMLVPEGTVPLVHNDSVNMCAHSKCGQRSVYSACEQGP